MVSPLQSDSNTGSDTVEGQDNVSKKLRVSKALQFNVLKQLKYARASLMTLPHGEVMTPVFMPVGTKGTIKSLTSQQLYEPALSPQIILGNTYHLALQPGTELISDFGGLHGFMNWQNNLLTDSGESVYYTINS